MISKNKKLNCAFTIINNFDINFAFDKTHEVTFGSNP